MIYFADTSAILNKCYEHYENLWISPLVVAELENIKTNSNKDDNLKYLARKATRDIALSNKYNIYYPKEKKINQIIKSNPYLNDIPDNRILAAAYLLKKEKGDSLLFITSDANLYNSCFTSMTELHCLYWTGLDENKDNFYCGYNKYYPTEEELIDLYKDDMTNNILNAKINEYCEIFDNNKTLVDILRWDGNKYQHLKYNNIENKTLGIKVTPRNLNQKMMFDLLQNPEIPIKLITGVYGSGKDYCALIHALNLIEKGKKDKLVFIRNLIDLKDTPQIGFLPNDIEQKIGWGLGPIKDILGGDEALELFTSQHQIEAVNLGFCRGRSWENAIIYVTEGQNLTKSQIKLLISRIGNDSELIINGDYHGQVDKEIFEKDNGIKAMQKKLVGQPMFGCVDLIKTERSKMAELATLLD